jgi:excisionase family DNA binding protein
MKKDFYTLQEAADYTGMSLSWWRKITGDRRIPVVQLGRKNLIRKADLDKFIEDAVVEAKEEG